MPRLASKRPNSYLENLDTQYANAYIKARNLLSSSFIDVLVGRDDEYKVLYDIIKFGLENQQSSTIYVSGPAGTGKTLTSSTVLNDLLKQSNFKLIALNCMSFQNAQNFYEKLLSYFDDSKSTKRSRNVGIQINNNQTIKLFDELKESIAKSKHMTVLFLDEIDQLKDKNQETLQKIFKLPLLLNEKIILIGVANALDFTAKLSFLKFNNDRFSEIRFLPYNKKQIVQIIENRLKLSNNENLLIDSMAIEFCARKIASSSGDIRKALDVCRRAIELIDTNTSAQKSPSAKSIGNFLKSKDSHINIRNSMQIDDESKTIECSQKRVDVKVMINVLNKVYGNAIDKINSTDNQSRKLLPSDQQIIVATFLIFLKYKSQREIKLSEFRELLSKICKRNGMSGEGKSESEILNMCQYLSDYGYVNVSKRESLATINSSSPFKRNQKRSISNASITLSLMIEAFEAEQLISTFHQSIINDAISFM
ncbi:Cell division control protein 6 -like protein [Sarcoptes scabiei]|uniref:Cell division control protein 6 -like protein n=1 Tax=Sarcoptes scabiei TaxID=52283 RepID=A0A834R2G4_SARSC|nr:Cell division control protein 6 -like protein [Sarcoptes scabiei]